MWMTKAAEGSRRSRLSKKNLKNPPHAHLFQVSRPSHCVRKFHLPGGQVLQHRLGGPEQRVVVVRFQVISRGQKLPGERGYEGAYVTRGRSLRGG